MSILSPVARAYSFEFSVFSGPLPISIGLCCGSLHLHLITGGMAAANSAGRLASTYTQKDSDFRIDLFAMKGLNYKPCHYLQVKSLFKGTWMQSFSFSRELHIEYIFHEQ